MHWTDNDTIVAPASPPGGSERAIVRLSGPDAFRLLDTVFRPDAPAPAAGVPAASPLRRGRIDGWVRIRCPVRASAAPDGWLPGATYCMPAPRSYTREDVAEVHLPGAPGAVTNVLRTLTDAGARPAGPGEFTLRAFLNGRLDLAQAEAVERLIAAGSDRERRAALAGMEGLLSARVRAWRDRLADTAALVEGQIDFEEDEFEPIPHDALRTALDGLAAELGALLDEAALGGDADGAATVRFIGRTNAGKSSLVNALLGRDASLVAPEPSTTRDRLDHALVLEPFHFVLQDAPGLDPAGTDLARAASAQDRKSVV